MHLWAVSSRLPKLFPCPNRLFDCFKVVPITGCLLFADHGLLFFYWTERLSTVGKRILFWIGSFMLVLAYPPSANSYPTYSGCCQACAWLVPCNSQTACQAYSGQVVVLLLAYTAHCFGTPERLWLCVIKPKGSWETGLCTFNIEFFSSSNPKCVCSVSFFAFSYPVRVICLTH